MKNTEIEAALNWRYAVKKFDAAKKISEADWKTLVDALVKSPSSYGLQPWKFIVVKNPELRQTLRPLSWNQTQVTDASHFVVFATRESISEKDVDTYMKRIQEVRGVTRDSLKGFEDMLNGSLAQGLNRNALEWTRRQAYIAMGFLMHTAALLKIDSTPMEGLDPAAYDRQLGLEGTGWRTVSAVALGYRHAEDAFQNLKKVRFKEADVVEYR